MASGRDYLSSIIMSASRLQNLSDEKLEAISDGLARVDAELCTAVEYTEGN